MAEQSIGWSFFTFNLLYCYFNWILNFHWIVYIVQQHRFIHSLTSYVATQLCEIFCCLDFVYSFNSVNNIQDPWKCGKKWQEKKCAGSLPSGTNAVATVIPIELRILFSFVRWYSIQTFHTVSQVCCFHLHLTHTKMYSKRFSGISLSLSHNFFLGI